jgi:hypothetical protein
VGERHDVLVGVQRPFRRVGATSCHLVPPCSASCHLVPPRATGAPTIGVDLLRCPLSPGLRLCVSVCGERTFDVPTGSCGCNIAPELALKGCSAVELIAALMIVVLLLLMH